MPFRLATLTAAVLAAAAAAQVPTRIDHPRLEPAADDLARLNLVTQWRLYLPVDTGGAPLPPSSRSTTRCSSSSSPG